VPGGLLQGEEYAFGINGEHLVVVVFGYLGKCFPGRYAGVGYENVDSAPLGQCLLEEGRNLVGPAYVCPDE
jgi:hypothetical protein